MAKLVKAKDPKAVIFGCFHGFSNSESVEVETLPIQNVVNFWCKEIKVCANVECWKGGIRSGIWWEGSGEDKSVAEVRGCLEL